VVGPWGIGAGTGAIRDCIAGANACPDWAHLWQDGDCTAGTTGTGAGAMEVIWKGDVWIGDCTIGICVYPYGAP
jgi:hypothetical protein